MTTFTRKIVLTAAAIVAASAALTACTATATTEGHASKPAATAPSTAPAAKQTPTPAAQPKVGDVVPTWTSNIPNGTILYPNGDGHYTVISTTGPLPAQVQQKVAAAVKQAYSSGDGNTARKARYDQAANTGHTLVCYGYFPATSGADAGYLVLVTDGRAGVAEPSLAAAKALAEQDAAALGAGAAVVPVN